MAVFNDPTVWTVKSIDYNSIIKHGINNEIIEIVYT